MKDGNTLANSLISWVPEEIQYYNYKDGVFVTEEEFEELVDEWYDYESKYFWREHFPGHYPESEDDQIRTNYLNALSEHGMDYEDWPHPSEFATEWMVNFVDDWLALCGHKDWDPHSEDHDGAKWMLINSGLRLDDYDAYSDTSEEDNGEEENKVEDEDRVEAKICLEADGAPILPLFVIKGLMSPPSTTA